MLNMHDDPRREKHFHEGSRRQPSCVASPKTFVLTTCWGRYTCTAPSEPDFTLQTAAFLTASTQRGAVSEEAALRNE